VQLARLDGPSSETLHNCCREQVQQILEANSSNVMQNNRPLWLVDSSKTLYIAHTGKSLSLPESCP